MARIRSIHPGLASDEAFMSMTMAAKAAWSVLWTECDDHGVFEWKPIVLKARIFPADNVDFAAILAEYQSLGCVERRDIGGKSFGYIKNFCKYQRPKHPSYRYPFPEEMHVFADYFSKATGQEGEDSPIATEKPPQMKEEGGSEEKKVYRRVAKATTPVDETFEEFWKAYPSRKGDNPKAPARKLFSAFVKQGVDAQAIIAGVKAACARNREKIGTEFIPQAVKWLRDRRWEDYAGASLNLTVIERDWRTIVARYRDHELWTAPGPEPGYAGCQAPDDVLREFGFLAPVDTTNQNCAPLVAGHDIQRT